MLMKYLTLGVHIKAIDTLSFLGNKGEAPTRNLDYIFEVSKAQSWLTVAQWLDH